MSSETDQAAGAHHSQALEDVDSEDDGDSGKEPAEEVVPGSEGEDRFAECTDESQHESSAGRDGALCPGTCASSERAVYLGCVFGPFLQPIRKVEGEPPKNTIQCLQSAFVVVFSPLKFF